MEGDLVLITGVTGHIGFRVLRLALEYGYPVRAVVRSQAKADAVLSNPVLKAMEKDDKLEMVIVPDLTMPHAFDEAAKDVKYVIHCASPVPFGPPTTDDAYNEFIKPAVDGTLGMLDSAFQSPSVRRIVVTSSCIAVATVAAAVSDTGETYTADTRQPEMEGPFSPGTPSLVAYAAGKVAALNRAEVWMKERRPHFDTIHLMPSFVVGRNDLCTSSGDMLAGTNRFPLDIARGQSPGDGAVAAMAMAVNHVDDCARIHVEALDPKISGGQSFIICYDSFSQPQWDDAKAIVAKHFPDAVKAGILPNEGGIESIFCRLESSKTEQTFGFRYSYEDAVISAVEQYLELYEKEKLNGGGS